MGGPASAKRRAPRTATGVAPKTGEAMKIAEADVRRVVMRAVVTGETVVVSRRILEGRVGCVVRMVVMRERRAASSDSCRGDGS